MEFGCVWFTQANFKVYVSLLALCLTTIKHSFHSFTNHNKQGDNT